MTMVMIKGHKYSFFYENAKILMKVNILNADRIIRLALAVLLIVLNAAGAISGLLGVGLLIAGTFFLLTGILGFCPLYWSFRF